MSLNEDGTWSDSGGTKWRTHEATLECFWNSCVIHNPGDHHMREWPIYMRTDPFKYGLMERFCKHGIGHPDPDSLGYYDRNGDSGWGVHGCDRCCCE